jgi:hypothetical protein
VVKVDADYISTLQIKNRTLKKMLDCFEEEYHLEGQFETRKEELLILHNFDEADRKLEYFNHKALILAVIDENSRPFYSIPPHCSPEKLIDMIDTNDSENNLSENEPIEYISENEEEGFPLKAEKKRSKREFDSEGEEESPKGEARKGQPRSKKFFLLEDE